MSEQKKRLQDSYVAKYWKNRLKSVYVPMAFITITMCIGMVIYSRDWNYFRLYIGETSVLNWYIQMLTVWYLAFGIGIKFIKSEKCLLLFLYTVSIGICVYCVARGVFKTYYDTSFCFPLGSTWSMYGDKVKKRTIAGMSLAAFVSFVIFAEFSFQRTEVFYTLLRTISSFMFCLVCLGVVQVTDFSRNTLAKCLGKCSFPIFLCHLHFLNFVGDNWKQIVVYYGMSILLGILYTFVIREAGKVMHPNEI